MVPAPHQIPQPGEPVPGTAVHKTSGCKNQQKPCPDEKGGILLKGLSIDTLMNMASASVKGQHSKSTKGGTELSGFRVRAEQAPFRTLQD